MYCRHCGKQIDDDAVICVGCGVPTSKYALLGQQNNNVVDEKKVNGFGIAGFVVGLLSLILGLYFCIAPIVGLALSIVGLAKSKRCKANGFAAAGLTLSIIALLFWILIWAIALIGIIGGATF